MKTTLVDFEQFSAIDFQDPCNFYAKTAMGYIYIHTNEREDAQLWLDNEYGKGHYKVRASKMTQPKGLVEGHYITAKG